MEFQDVQPETFVIPQRDPAEPIPSMYQPRPQSLEKTAIFRLREEEKQNLMSQVIAAVLAQMPKPQDGKTPTNEELAEIVAKVVPQVQNGKDGSPDTGKEIVTKINGLAIKPNEQIDFGHIKNFPWHEIRKRQDDGGGIIAWGAGTRFIDNETPSGTIDGVNADFTLTNAPFPTSSLVLVLNGQFQTQGVEYTLSGSTITFATALDAAFSGLPFKAFYRY